MGCRLYQKPSPPFATKSASDYGARYIPKSPRVYKSKAKNAQEAHEAIRPTDIARKPSELAKRLDSDQAKLYDLIWKRTVASQMASAEIAQTRADISVDGKDGKDYTVRATGSVVVFDGFLKAYDEGPRRTPKSQPRQRGTHLKKMIVTVACLR